MSDWTTVKFSVGQPVEVVLAYDTPRDGQYGPFYGCENSVGFNASKGLHAIIQKMGAKQGAELTIEKHEALNESGEPYTYFKVNGKSMSELEGNNGDEYTSAAPAPAAETPAAAANASIKTGDNLDKLNNAMKLLSEVRDSIKDVDLPF